MRLVGAVLACLLLVAPGVARAADLGARTLSDAGQVVTWQGDSTDPTGQGYGPPTEQSCTSDSCDTLTLKLDLPPGTFPKRPRAPAPDGVSRVQAEGPSDSPGDGVLITVKWATDFDQWNLYVDDMSTGQTVA